MFDNETASPAADAALAAQARALDADPGAAPGAAPPAPGAELAPGPHDFGADATAILDFALHSLTPFFPSLARIYTPDVRSRLDPALGRLFAKYDFDLAAFFARWEPEVRFALVAGPLIAPTILAVRADLAAAKAAEEKAKAAPPAST